MVNKKVFLRISLLVFTGISCSLVSKVFTKAEPTEAEQPESYSFGVPSTLPTPTLRAESQIEKALQKSELDDASIPILCEHRVAFGETLECIGRGYGVIPERIADINGIELTSDLEVGQDLLIPAVPWENISDGPVCLPQCIPPDWDLGITEATGPEGNNEGNNAARTEDDDENSGNTSPGTNDDDPSGDDCPSNGFCPDDSITNEVPGQPGINPPLPFDLTDPGAECNPGECPLPIIIAP